MRISKKNLSFICMMGIIFLCACSKEVENQATSVLLNNEEIMGSFTGTLNSGKADGIGKFKPDDAGWVYEGNFEIGQLIGNGTISSYDCDANICGEKVFGLFDGTIEDFKLKEGSFKLKDGGEYNGQFADGNPVGEAEAVNLSVKYIIDENEVSGCYTGKLLDGEPSGEGHLSADAISIDFLEEKLCGSYEGEVVDGKPSGNGKFVCEDDVLFEYDGLWNNGKMAGKGYLSTDIYTIKFSGVDRVGTYEGETLDGLASGEGVFTAVSSEGNKYTYTGEFANGTYNGVGERSFEDNIYSPAKGHYVDGEFAPTKLELVSYIGGVKDFVNYNMNEAANNFFEEHEDFFIAEDTKALDEFTNKEITINELYKSPDKFGGELVKLNKLKIIQIREEELAGYTVTWFIANDSKYNTVFVLALGELPNIYTGNRVNVTGLPVGLAAYSNRMGGQTNACAIIASSVSK